MLKQMSVVASALQSHIIKQKGALQLEALKMVLCTIRAALVSDS